jgi:hypothetical protein
MKTKIYPKEVLNVIPKGYYCYNGMTRNDEGSYEIGYNCPFWFRIKGRSKQENGYCALLGKGDYELNRETHTVKVTSYVKGVAQKPVKIKYNKDNPDWSSLLWDQCKEHNCPKK